MQPEAKRIVVGWQDEMGRGSAALWTPIPSEYGPAAPSPGPGTLRLNLRPVPPGFPFAYQWGGVTRIVEVDLDRFPLLAVRARRLGERSYWDFGVHVLAGGTVAGNTVAGNTVAGAARSPGRVEPGIAFLDVPKETGATGLRRMEIRLHVGGALAGAWAEYDWARFVRREDAERLRRNPDSPVASGLAGPLLVGWSDELNLPRQWMPLAPGGAPDVFCPRRGVLGLRLGRGAVVDNRVTAPYPYQWASVWRVATVDLDRYPLLAVRALRVSADAWWDVTAQLWRNNGPVGPEAKTPSVDHPGVVLFDLTREAGWTGKTPVRLRLNVAGLKRGGAVEYAWIRFLRREDAERLRRNPDEQDLVVAP